MLKRVLGLEDETVREAGVAPLQAIEKPPQSFTFPITS